jgi:colicin import membrane protein
MIPVHRNEGPGGPLFLSICLHLAMLAVVWWLQFLPQFEIDKTPVTYVDMVTLPVASPQSGTPSAQGPASAPAPAAAAPAAMSLPASKPAAAGKLPPVKAKSAEPTAADTKRFNERMAKLQQQAEDKRQADVMENLRKRTRNGAASATGAAGNKGRVGMPGATGTEAGADYGAYLQSRLKDAFAREVTVSAGKSPVLIGAVTVGADGHLDLRVEKYSDDPLFNESVSRAVTTAGSNLRPPPGGKSFRRTFRFRPEGVGMR